MNSRYFNGLRAGILCYLEFYRTGIIFLVVVGARKAQRKQPGNNAPV